MNLKSRTIEVDAETAQALESEAAARGMSVAEFLAELANVSAEPLAPELEAMRAEGRGPWSPQILAEDARRLAGFLESGEGVPWTEVDAWMKSWGSPDELPPPKPRKL